MIVRQLQSRGLLIAAYAFSILAIGCGETTTTSSTPTPEPSAETTAAATVETSSVTTTAPETTGTTASQAPDAAPAADSDITGAYFATSPLPPEFAELDHLLLAYIGDNGEPAPLNGFLRPKKASATDYTLVKPVLNGRNLTFTTAAVNGTHYTFTGSFVRLATFAADPPDPETPVLSGTLTKMREGKSVATTPVEFAYRAGD
jgi:hypothetical protein